MALVFDTNSLGIAYGLPGTIPRTVNDRGKEVGTMHITRKLKLDSSAYVTGGWDLGVGVTKMKAVWGMDQLACKDPQGKPVDYNGYQAVLLINPGPKCKLKLYFNGVEATNASTAAAGKYLWLRFYGVS